MNASRSYVRREFLRLSALGMGCLSVGLREAVARAADTGKPVLTQASVNAWLRQEFASDTYAGLGRRAGTLPDLKATIRGLFTLTPAQDRELDSLTTSDFTQLVQAMATARTKKRVLGVMFRPPPPPRPAPSPPRVPGQQVQDADRDTAQPLMKLEAVELRDSLLDDNAPGSKPGGTDVNPYVVLTFSFSSPC
jgi:hypothetical protein